MVPNPPTTTKSKTPAKMEPLTAVSPSNPSLSASIPFPWILLLLSSSSPLGLKNQPKLRGALVVLFLRVFCFLVCFKDEHGLTKWKRLWGLKLWMNELEDVRKHEGGWWQWYCGRKTSVRIVASVSFCCEDFVPCKLLDLFCLEISTDFGFHWWSGYCQEVDKRMDGILTSSCMELWCYVHPIAPRGLKLWWVLELTEMTLRCSILVTFSTWAS